MKTETKSTWKKSNPLLPTTHGFKTALRSRGYLLEIVGFYNEAQSDREDVQDKTRSLIGQIESFLNDEPVFGNMVELKLRHEVELSDARLFTISQKWSVFLAGGIVIGAIVYQLCKYNVI